MKSIYHPSDSRGYADHGWLKSYHTFSFANYFDPERIHFGALRVINDDNVTGGMGFGAHSHSDMEIISIPLSGFLKHGDNIGNSGIITPGEIQVMSAGTGITHSEMNGKENEPVKFLQIWVLPNKKGVEPRYQQLDIDSSKVNEFVQILSPNPEDDGVWIHQDAWFSMGHLTAGNSQNYQLHNANNGVYVFVIEGKISVNGQNLNERDGLGVWEIDLLEINAHTDAKVLLMEVPMVYPS